MGQIAQDAPLFKRILVFVPKNAVFSEQTCHFEGFVPVFGHFSEQIFSYADIALPEYAIPKAAGGLPGCFKLQRPGMTVGEDPRKDTHILSTVPDPEGSFSFGGSNCLNRHEATLYGGGHALYNAVQTEFPFYAFFIAVHGVEGNFKGRCNL